MNANNTIKMLLIILLICNVSCNKEDTKNINEFQDVSLLEKVGRDNDSSTNLEIITSFKNDWEERLDNNGFKVSLSNEFQLFKNTKRDTYFLVASSNDKSIKTAVELLKIGDDYYWLSVFGTVTCSGCRIGCDPKKNGKNWICSKCSGQYKKCTKTVTVRTNT